MKYTIRTNELSTAHMFIMHAEGCKDRRNAAPAGMVAQSARMATILGPGARASATRR